MIDKGVQNETGLLFMLTMSIGGGYSESTKKECFMKKAFRVMFLVVIAIIAMGSIYAETFEKVELLDDFGDPTGVSYVQAKKDFDGTYKNTNGVSNGKLKWNIKLEDGKVTFILKENGQVNQLSTAYYTSDTFEVKVKDNETGNTATYSGAIAMGEEGAYNCIIVKTSYGWFTTNNLSSELINGIDCKIVISNSRGSYSLGSLNASEIETLWYDFDSFNTIQKAYESERYEEVVSLIEDFKNSDEKSYKHFSSELYNFEFMAKNKLGIYEVGFLGQAGGYIFYDVDADNESGNADGLISSECGWRFLEAAPADLRVVNGIPTVDSSIDGYSSAPAKYTFGYYRTSDNGSSLYVNGTTKYSSLDCTGEYLGAGEGNTEKLVSAMGDNAYLYDGTTTDQYAAKLCDDLEYNGCDDWFLPSQKELDRMFTNLDKIGKNSFADSYYWSSSEKYNYAKDAYYLDFSFGFQNSDDRSYDLYIRPCRAF